MKKLIRLLYFFNNKHNFGLLSKAMLKFKEDKRWHVVEEK